MGRAEENYSLFKSAGPGPLSDGLGGPGVVLGTFSSHEGVFQSIRGKRRLLGAVGCVPGTPTAMCCFAPTGLMTKNPVFLEHTNDPYINHQARAGARLASEAGRNHAVP